MSARSFMLIAGEPSGDALAAELVKALKQSPELQALPFPARFFGAGGSKMAAAGVELAFDLTRHSVIGLWEAVKKVITFNRLCNELVNLACARQPDVIICVDFSEFNRRFAHAVKERVRQQGGFGNWNPKLVKYISPQVWASRPGRAQDLAKDHDLLLTIFPFEKAWYAERAPELRVEFVGHPMIDRFGSVVPREAATAEVLLLPGSRVSELRRHLPVMMAAAQQINAAKPTPFRMVLPDQSLTAMVEPWRAGLLQLEIQIGGLAEALAKAQLAIASTGTVTMECAYFRVPTVALYKTSWSTYLIGKQIVTIRYLAMPNLLADSVVFPEFVQGDATPANISRAALELLDSPTRRHEVQTKLTEIIATLGGPGANQRAARAILE